MNRFGKARRGDAEIGARVVIAPGLADGVAAAAVISIGDSIFEAWKPVARMMTSTSCTVPSAITMASSVMRAIGPVSSSTFGRFSMRYQ